eukprot:TRINITY_DN12314_c0_g2_i3.p1 TRINITY_DN12314_c0_g2~~TRINITY_DN12314_c0_g2_i3.p1  ORF type:complete len:102 (-),score=18.75 TRINITY_DN12314_c0_g2_i3:290-595(-)
MDDTSFWALFLKFASLAVTTRSSITYLRPLPSGRPFKITASVLEKTGKKVQVSSKICDGDGNVCSSGIYEFALVSPQTMEKILNFTFPDEFLSQLKNVSKL